MVQDSGSVTGTGKVDASIPKQDLTSLAATCKAIWVIRALDRQVARA